MAERRTVPGSSRAAGYRPSVLFLTLVALIGLPNPVLGQLLDSGPSDFEFSEFRQPGVAGVILDSGQIVPLTDGSLFGANQTVSTSSEDPALDWSPDCPECQNDLPRVSPEYMLGASHEGTDGWAEQASSPSRPFSVLCPACVAGRIFHPPQQRHRGVGQPLLRESWRYRPFSAGWFMGYLQGSPLVDDWVRGDGGYFGGYRFGWDFDHYRGWETRFAYGYAALRDSQRAKDAQRAADDALGLPADHSFRNRFDQRRDMTVVQWDMSYLYYPWGDAAWRPYASIGVGIARIDFQDRLSVRTARTVLTLPFALGIKYRWNDRLALRIEGGDNIAFGDGFNTVHNLSLTGGFEIRFGGMRTAYWPWNPGRHYW